MGQKVHPVGYRLGVTAEWQSKWYAGRKDYAKKLHEDLKLREYIMKKWDGAGISRIEIERVGNVIRFTIWTARPGVVIGRNGAEIQAIKDELGAMTGAKIMVNVHEIKNPDVEAQLVAEGIAASLERRVSFRRAMKQAIFRATKAGVLGVKAQVAGRLGGAEIARTEWYNEGRLPLSTIKADIDYGFAEANTMYGVIGCKIWIYRDRDNERPMAMRTSRRERGGDRERDNRADRARG
ncbi:MAG: 30S ribosomal protein S3 [Synergistaceae bacterium]|nr:30S ribosomal protein S3 [Synergistaceae bacterium]MBQ4418037.1 30S ribosomal protein S3 [Synergistaceae bacterium]MBQ6739603.1 30S ribosomal protein S3 [Synergistaceae bacterium]MBQ6908587.1 30S ribosomal protein S3 [Synergistaceae bacterium]MBQ9896043.1 30S ribosomal protein S3 [Synergistaceae bacterium]